MSIDNNNYDIGKCFINKSKAVVKGSMFKVLLGAQLF